MSADPCSTKLKTQTTKKTTHHVILLYEKECLNHCNKDVFAVVVVVVVVVIRFNATEKSQTAQKTGIFI
jgi:hypothetical protein